MGPEVRAAGYREVRLFLAVAADGREEPTPGIGPGLCRALEVITECSECSGNHESVFQVGTRSRGAGVGTAWPPENLGVRSRGDGKRASGDGGELPKVLQAPSACGVGTDCA